MLGPQLKGRHGRHPEHESKAARAAGLEIVNLKTARLRIEIFDIAAVVYLLRKLVWWVPSFTVEEYSDRLRELDQQIRRDGVFIAHSTRHLIEAKRP